MWAVIYGLRLLSQYTSLEDLFLGWSPTHETVFAVAASSWLVMVWEEVMVTRKGFR